MSEINKQTIHEEFNEDEWLQNMLYLVGKDANWEAILVLIEQKLRHDKHAQIQQLLDSVVPEEKDLLEPKDRTTQEVNMKKAGYNQAIAEMKEKIKKAGFSIN